MKLKPEAARQIRANRRALRRQKLRAPADIRDRCWFALRGLTELEADPLRPGLAVQAAMNVRRTQAAA